jgi:hypothetical protein
MKLAELEQVFYDSVRADAPPPGIARIFVGDSQLGAARRMGIYHSAYWARQLRVLQETFSHVSRALGDEGFRQLARAYLVDHPSEKAAIELIGERFPAFVEKRRAQLPAIVPALARLEWARTEALLAPDPANQVRREHLVGVEFWRIRAVFAKHVRVLRLPRSALRYANHDGEASVDPALDETVCTVVYRRAFKVRQVPFPEPEGSAIELAARRRPFAEVCEAFGSGVPVTAIAATIGAWIDRGWFERLEEGTQHAT